MDKAQESISFLNKQNKYVISVTSSTLLITNYLLTTTTVTTNIVLGANNLKIICRVFIRLHRLLIQRFRNSSE